MENVKIDFLKNIELFSGLDDEELNQITGKVLLKEVKKNEIILYEEDTSEFMYIVIFGKVIAFLFLQKIMVAIKQIVNTGKIIIGTENDLRQGHFLTGCMISDNICIKEI